MSNRKTIAFNTMSQIAGKVVTSGTTFIVSILIARSLGAGGYGDFTKITTFVAFFYLFADFGLNTAYLELSENKSAQNNLLTIRTVLGLFLMFLCISILAFLPGTNIQGYTPFVKFGIIVFSFSILFQSLITTANAFFQKNFRYDYASYALSLGAIATLLSVFSLPYLGVTGLFPSIIAFLLGSCITVVTSLFFAKRLLPTLSFSFDSTLIKKMLTIAFPLGLTLLCNVVYFHADSVILTLTRSSAEVGVYGFAYKFFELPLVVPTFFMNAVFPLLLLSRKSTDWSAFSRQAKQSAAILLSLSVIIVVCGYVAAPLLSLIKSDFQGSILPFRILLLSLPIFYLTSVTMWVLIAIQKRIQLFCIYFLTMFINIGSNIVFIPTYGYIASAWITVVSETLVLLLSFIVIQRHFANEYSN
jgi:O-antigen/teichoic acid export membrane protein